MKLTATTTALTLALALGVPTLPVAASAHPSAEDDLAVVKNATRNGQAQPAEAPPRSTGEEPSWLRVRIVEKGKKKATVKVNLPLALVYAFGDDVPLPGCGKDSGRHLTVGEVLKALDTGESLVEIQDEDATVRVWVE